MTTNPLALAILSYTHFQNQQTKPGYTFFFFSLFPNRKKLYTPLLKRNSIPVVTHKSICKQLLQTKILQTIIINHALCYFPPMPCPPRTTNLPRRNTSHPIYPSWYTFFLTSIDLPSHVQIILFINLLPQWICSFIGYDMHG